MSLSWQNPNPKLAWQGRHYTGPQRINNVTGTGGVDTVYAPGYGPSSVVESPGFQAPAAVPASTTNVPATETSPSPLDFLSSLPNWVWLAVAAGVIYWVFIKKGR